MQKPRYVHDFIDSRGKPRNAFRRAGQIKVPLRWPMYNEAWWKAYHAALAGTPEPTPGAGAFKTVPGTMNALIVEYYQSSAFTSNAATTQATYRNQLEAIRKEHGDKPVALIKTKHIDALLGEIAKKSTAQAQKLKKRHTTLFRLAVKWGYREDNPMPNVQDDLQRPNRMHYGELNFLKFFRFRHTARLSSSDKMETHVANAT